MEWEAIGAIGDILGAVAVLATLIYLAAQIRQNTASVATATYESMMSGITDINLVVVGSPEVASILLRGALNPDSLDVEEAFRYAFIMRCYANQGLKQLRLYEQGALGAADWEKLARELSQAFGSPGGQRFRAGNRVFEDLYAEIEKYEGSEISDWALRGRSEDDA